MFVAQIDYSDTQIRSEHFFNFIMLQQRCYRPYLRFKSDVLNYYYMDRVGEDTFEISKIQIHEGLYL